MCALHLQPSPCLHSCTLSAVTPLPQPSTPPADTPPLPTPKTPNPTHPPGACRRAGTAPHCWCSATARRSARAWTATACAPHASGAPPTTPSTWPLRSECSGTCSPMPVRGSFLSFVESAGGGQQGWVIVLFAKFGLWRVMVVGAGGMTWAAPWGCAPHRHHGCRNDDSCTRLHRWMLRFARRVQTCSPVLTHLTQTYRCTSPFKCSCV